MAEVQLAHAGEARTALLAIMSDPGHGVEALISATRMSGLLQDLLPDAPREASLLLSAVGAGVPSDLRDHVAGGMDIRTAIRLAASSLADRTAFGPDICLWVVTEFAVALGLINDRDGPVTEVARPPGTVEPAYRSSGQTTATTGGSAEELPTGSGAPAGHLSKAADPLARVARAIPRYERTVVGRERSLGADHPLTMTSREHLASAYESVGRFDDAISLYELNLAGIERSLGPDHPDALAARHDLARVHETAGRLAEAIGLFEETAADYERVLGLEHQDTLAAQNNLAGAYESAGRIDEAIALFEDTAADYERVLGPDHRDTLAAQNNLAHAYETAGRLGEATALFELTVAGMERLLGRSHPDTTRSRLNLERATSKLGRQ